MDSVNIFFVSLTLYGELKLQFMIRTALSALLSLQFIDDLHCMAILFTNSRIM